MASEFISGYPAPLALPVGTANGTEVYPADQVIGGLRITKGFPVASLFGALSVAYGGGNGLNIVASAGNAVMTLVDNSTSSTTSFQLAAQSDTNGVNFKMTGNGSNPAKFLRVMNGAFQVLNSAYTQALMSITDAGNITVGAPTSGIAITATGVAGSVAAQFTGNSTTGSSDGVFINSGTNSSDFALAVANQTNSQQFLKLFGDGSFVLGFNGTAQTINGAATGAVSIPAPTSGAALTVTGVNAANHAAVFTTPSDAQVVINAAGSGQFSTLQFTQNGVLTGQLFVDNVNGFVEITNNGGANGVKISQGTGPIVGAGPIAAAFVDMTPDRGTFTMTHTGFTTAVTSTATWYRIGKLVTINTGTVSGTSNATTWTATGLPVGLQTSLSQIIGLADMEDNSAAVFGNVALATSSSTLTFGKGANSGGAWTNAGSKGFFNTGGTTFSYLTG